MPNTDASRHIVLHRTGNAEAAIIFVHGFQGKAAETWGRFADLLTAEPRLKTWDVISLGYTTGLRIDLAGIWSADPELQKVADFIRTMCSLEPIAGYKTLALLAHSMGGLVVQRALLDDEALVARASHVMFFGTPSGGLVKAWLAQRLKRQFRDMARGGPFVSELRRQWDDRFGEQPPFTFRAVAGETDEFVPYDSSLAPFSSKFREVAPGSHLEIVKPKDAEHPSVKLVIDQITGQPMTGGRWNSARVAVQEGEFQRVIDLLEPHSAELDDGAAVQLAIALEKRGRQADAIKLLTSRGKGNTDAMGTLAGRLKRRWMRERRQTDADTALNLYLDAYRLSSTRDPEQAFYHAINVAFMQLAYKGDINESQTWAMFALAHTAQAAEAETKPDCWRLATDAEARLLLDRQEEALKLYEQAIRVTTDPWKWDSMFTQATEIARQLEEPELTRKLSKIFDKPLV